MRECVCAAYAEFLICTKAYLDFSPYSVDFHTLNARCEMSRAVSSAAHASRPPSCEGGVTCMPMTALIMASVDTLTRWQLRK